MPGTISFIGSGETSNTGGEVFEAVARGLSRAPRVGIMETPAGFEINSQWVAERVANYVRTRLGNYRARVELVRARKRGTPLSPDSPEVIAPLLESNLIFMGPGSPSYAVRQLRDSLAWQVIQARQRLGAGLVLASAAAIAVGALALPVYEIYKVGEEPHWKPGLDLLGPYGLKLVIVPHWNNRDGGEALDTSHCFMGAERFTGMVALLPPGLTLLGLDENCALSLDFEAGVARVWGLGEIHLVRDGQETACRAGCEFPLTDLGEYRPLASAQTGLPAEVWQMVAEAAANQDRPALPVEVPDEVNELVEQREAARRARDYPAADRLRRRITELGWQVADTPEGPRVSALAATE